MHLQKMFAMFVGYNNRDLLWA